MKTPKRLRLSVIILIMICIMINGTVCARATGAGEFSENSAKAYLLLDAPSTQPIVEYNADELQDIA